MRNVKIVTIKTKVIKVTVNNYRDISLLNKTGKVFA